MSNILALGVLGAVVLVLGSLTIMVRRASRKNVASGDAMPTGLAGTGFFLHLPTGQCIALDQGRRLSTQDLPGTEAASGTLVAEVARNPHNSAIFGLKNLTPRPWSAILANGANRQVAPGQTIQLAAGVRIHFGSLVGTIAANNPNALSRKAYQTAALLAGIVLVSGLVIANGYRRGEKPFDSPAPSSASQPPSSQPDAPAVASAGEKLHFRGHTDAVLGLAFSPNGQMAASASSDRTIRLWNVADGTLLRVLRGHGDRVQSVAFHPQGDLLASCSLDGTVRLWRVPSGVPLLTIRSVEPGCGIAFSSDGVFLAGTGSEGRFYFWKTDDGRSDRVLEGWMLDPIFRSDGASLVGRTRRTIQIWDARSGARLRTITGLHGASHCVAVSPNGMLIAAGQCLVESQDAKTGRLREGIPDEFFQVYSATDGRVVHTLAGHSNCVTCCAFHPVDNTLLVSGSSDRTIKLWNLSASKVLATLTGHTQEVWTVAFSPDGRLLASGGNEGTVRIWRLADYTVSR